jgi:hypothetical protein
MKSYSDSYAVLAFSLPEEHFPDDDDICRTAGKHIASELGPYLEKCGHSIPDWVKGGCEEDAWVHFESERRDVRYEFTIQFFPRGRRDTRSMAVCYGVRVGFWQRLFHGYPVLATDDPIHEHMRTFGATQEGAELMTGDGV